MADNPIKYKELVTPDNSISELIELLSDLNKSYETSMKGIRKEAEETIKAYKSGIMTLEEFSKVANDLMKSMLNLKNSYKENSDQIVQLNIKVTERTKKEKELANELNNSTAAERSRIEITNKQAKINELAIGSLERMKAQLKLNQLELSKFSEEELKNSERATQLIKENGELSDSIKILNQTFKSGASTLEEQRKAEEAILSVYSERADKINKITEEEKAQINVIQNDVLPTYDQVLEKLDRISQFNPENFVKAEGTTKDYSSALNETSRNLTNLDSRQLELNDLLKVGAISQQEYAAASQKVSDLTIKLDDQYDDLNRKRKEGLEQTQQLTTVSDDASGAIVRLSTQIRLNKEALASMIDEGKKGTVEYQQLAQETAVLQKNLAEATNEVKNMASGTTALNTVMGAATAAGGAFSAYLGALNILGIESDDAQEAQRKLQASIALVTGATAVQKQLQSQSNLMIGIGTIQSKALTKATLLQEKATTASGKATIFATAQQRIFNAVANANPYVLLAIAMLTVVGALVLFSQNTDKAAKEQKKLNDLQQQSLENLNQRAARIKEESEIVVNSLENELKLAQAEKKGKDEILAIEQQIADERRKAANEQVKAAKDEITNLDANIIKLNKYNEALEAARLYQKAGSKLIFDVDTQQFVKVKDQIKKLEPVVETLTKSVNVARDAIKELATVDTNEGVKNAQELIAAQESEYQAFLQYQNAKTTAVKNNYDKQAISLKNSFAQQKRELEKQLKNTSEKEVATRKYINDTIAQLERNLSSELIKIEQERQKAILNTQRQTEDLAITLIPDDIDRQLATVEAKYTRQVEDIKTTIEQKRNELSQEEIDELEKRLDIYKDIYEKDIDDINNMRLLKELELQKKVLELRLNNETDPEKRNQLQGELSAKELEIELLQNKMLVEKYQVDENDIKEKYRLQDEQDKKQIDLNLINSTYDRVMSEIDILKTSEKEKTRLRLEAEKKRWQDILDLNDKYSHKMSADEIAVVENTIEKINQDIKSNKTGYTDIFDFLGFKLTDETKESLTSAYDFIKEQLQEIYDKQLDVANQALEEANNRVSELQSEYDKEKSLQDQGYANKADLREKELNDAKKAQKQALRDQEAAAKQQQAIESIQQTSSLVTGTAKILGQMAANPILAGITIATMWGLFFAAKAKAKTATKTESYGKGHVELLEGGSHDSGNDIDLGVKPDGTRRRAEGGEYFAVLDKRNSRRYKNVFPSVMKAFRNGTFEKQYLNSFDVNRVDIHSDRSPSVNLRRLEGDVGAIRRASERKTVTYQNNRKITKYKNLTTINYAN
ncbi:MAG: hypothetical protein LBP67_04990 [Bacteroidales bacterium]|jgi:hypothetical protein|nr:hypothetical protein [Bacteroidales bacterium]